MLSRNAVARDWGTSAQYVGKCVKNGCPLSSFEDARAWRLANASKRETVSAVQIERRIAAEMNDDSPEARNRRKEYLEDKQEAIYPTASSLDDALYASIRASDEAWRLLQEAMAEGRDTQISVRLAIHNKAMEARFEAEKSYREELERRRILVPLAEAQEMARKGFEFIVARLSALPQNLAPRCNPHDPHHAMEILQSECSGIIEDAQKQYSS